MSYENEVPSDEQVARSIIYKDDFFKQYSEIVPEVGERLERYVFDIRDALSALRASWEKDIDKLRSDHTEYEKIINSEYAKVKALEAEKKGLKDELEKMDKLEGVYWLRKLSEKLKEEKSALEKEKAGLEERVKDLLKGENESMEELTRLKSRNEELEAEKVCHCPCPDCLLTEKKKREVVEAERDRLKAENEGLLKRIGNLSTQAQSAKDNLKAYQNQLAISKRLSDECSRLTSALGAAMEIIRKILKQCYLTPVDHACIECVPAGSSVVEGFLCGVHEGVKALSDPSGSLALERWKKMNEIIEHEKIIRKKTDEVDLLMSDDLKRMDKLLCELEALDAKGERE